MSLQEFIDAIPDYAKDVRLNLPSVLSESTNTDLKQNQIYGIALASSYATRDKNFAKLVEEAVAGGLTETEINAAKSAATIMAMNNIYYRFIHLAADEETKKLRANLRMNIIQNHGIEKVDFELMSMAVSAINGCGMCMEAHSNELQKHGVTKQAVQASVRIAAVINSAAQVSFLS